MLKIGDRCSQQTLATLLFEGRGKKYYPEGRGLANSFKITQYIKRNKNKSNGGESLSTDGRLTTRKEDVSGALML